MLNTNRPVKQTITHLCNTEVFWIPDITYMTPRTDVCHICEEYRVSIRTALTESVSLCQGKRTKGGCNSKARILPLYF